MLLSKVECLKVLKEWILRLNTTNLPTTGYNCMGDSIFYHEFYIIVINICFAILAIQCYHPEVHSQSKAKF